MPRPCSGRICCLSAMRRFRLQDAQRALVVFDGRGVMAELVVDRGEVGQRVGQRQLFGAVLLFGELHEAFGQRLGLGVFLRVELRAEFLVDGDAVGVGDGERRPSETRRQRPGRWGSATRIYCVQPWQRLYRFSAFFKEVMRYQPFAAAGVSPEFRAGHEEHAPVHPPAQRLGGAVGARQHRHELGPVPVHVRKPGLAGELVVPAGHLPVFEDARRRAGNTAAGRRSA